MPSGASSSTLTIYPQPSTNLVWTRTAILTLKTDPAYTVASPSNATIHIAGNALPAKIARTGTGSIRLRWTSTVNKYYKIAYKDDLNASAWSEMGLEIRATETEATWDDPIRIRRFYMVYEAR
jgi:hypothetical protein